MKGLILGVLLVVGSVAMAQDYPGASWHPASSSNYTAVSYNRGITYVVIHTAEGSYWGTISWFQNPSAGASAHYVVSKTGQVAQMVKNKDIAWHAGNWNYNVHSIGIEHEGFTYQNGWTDAQYQASAKLTRWICLTYGIPMDRQHIIGHNEVPDPDGSGFGGANNHTDPGPYFDWTYYMNLVKNGTTAGAGGTSGGGTTGGGTTTVSGTKLVKATASSLNVRTGPGTNYSIVGSIPYGQSYVSIGKTGGWYKIWYNGSTAYIYGGYASATSGYVAKCTVSKLNVRKGPGTGYSIVGSMGSGQIYSLISSTGWADGWNRIYFKSGAYYSYSGSMSEYYLY